VAHSVAERCSLTTVPSDIACNSKRGDSAAEQRSGNLSKNKVFERVAGRRRIAAEHPERGYQNLFAIPTSQKVAEPRVSRGAEIKIFARKIGTNKINGLRGAKIRRKDDCASPF
jgi:hypothetical protein